MKFDHIKHCVGSYLRYRYKAVNRHGIHSPFVYGFNGDVLRPGLIPDECKLLQKIINQWSLSGKTFKKSDWGAGSLSGLKQNRTLADELKKTGISPKHGCILYKTIDYFQPKYCVELGTSAGASTLYQALALRKINGSRMYTIEGCKPTFELATENINGFENSTGIQLPHLHMELGIFREKLPEILQQIPRLDFAFIDGDHKGSSINLYYKLMKSKLHENSVLVFDDIHWSKDMEEGWHHLKQLPEVSVSVDIYRIGFLFFRKGMVKQDFVIKT